MRDKIPYLLLLFALFSGLKLQAKASETIDSLKMELSAAKEGDSLLAIVSLYAKIGRLYEDVHLDSAINWYRHQLDFLKKTPLSAPAKDSMLGAIYLDLSFIKAFIGYPTEEDMNTAYAYADTAYQIFTESAYFNMAVRAYNNKGLAQINSNQFNKAIENLIEALSLSDQIENSRERRMAQQGLLLNIGKAYLGLEQWPLALDYTRKAIAIKGIARYRMIALNNLAAGFLEMEEADSALVYAKKSLHIADSLGDDYHRLLNRVNEAEAYMKLKKYAVALPIIQANIEMSRAFEYPYGIASGLNQLAHCYGAQGNYKKALKVALEAEPLAQEVASKELLLDTWQNITECYAKLGRYDKAYQYQAQFFTLRDSLTSIAKTKDFNELLLRFESTQKEQQIAEQELALKAQEASIAQRDKQILVISASLVILLLVGGIVMIRLRQLQERSLQEALLIEKEKSLDAIINATEEERKRISKDLHDGIGQKLTALRLGLLNQVEKSSETERKSALEEIAQEFSRSAEELRQISHQMMPKALMEHGLVPALEDLMASSFKYSEIDYRFEHFRVKRRYHERLEVSLYRIAQELLNNALKHAQASEIQVQLMELEGSLILIVEDNGKGLDSGVKKNGQGLHNIKSRLDLLKGVVNYEFGGDTGMLATVKIPIS
tara:strand:- start:933 stop:2921 length:1989 start_codon:yes stop_codon:yes gene_type:complete